MKKLILTLGIFFAAIVCLQAQQPASVDAEAGKMLNKLTEVCKLTPDQITKVKPIIKQFVTTREANKAKYATNKSELQEANKANKDVLDSKLKPILTEDQEAMLKNFQQEQQEQKRANNAAHQ
jgi:hypothetical protein